MARECPICKKRATKARSWKKLRGKYNPSPKREQKPNLQWVRIPNDAKGKYKEFRGRRIKACTKCIKALRKSK